MRVPISAGVASASKSSSLDDASSGVASTEGLVLEPTATTSEAPTAARPKPPPARPHSVRRIARMIGQGSISAAAVGFGFMAYAYVTLPDVRPLRTTHPPTTAFIELPL